MGAQALRKWARFLLTPACGLLAACGQNAAPDDEIQPARAPEIVRIAPAQEALASSVLSTLDLATMNEAQIRSVIGEGPRCEFRYTSAGKPVLAVDMRAGETIASGIVKLNGKLVVLSPEPVDGPLAQKGEFQLAADTIRVTVAPLPTQGQEQDGARRSEAKLIFEIGRDLRIGYGGYLTCGRKPPFQTPRR